MTTKMEPDAVPLTHMEAAEWADSLAGDIDYEAALMIADELGHATASAHSGAVMLTNARRMRDALVAAARETRH